MIFHYISTRNHKDDIVQFLHRLLIISTKTSWQVFRNYCHTYSIQNSKFSFWSEWISRSHGMSCHSWSTTIFGDEKVIWLRLQQSLTTTVQLSLYHLCETQDASWSSVSQLGGLTSRRWAGWPAVPTGSWLKGFLVQTGGWTTFLGLFILQAGSVRFLYADEERAQRKTPELTATVVRARMHPAASRQSWKPSSSSLGEEVRQHDGQFGDTHPTAND